MLESFHKYPVFPDLLENQRRSIKFFWEKGILDELELFSTILGYNKEKNIGKSIQFSGSVKPQKTLTPGLRPSKSSGLATVSSDLKKTEGNDVLGAQNLSNVHFFNGFLSSRMAQPPMKGRNPGPSAETFGRERRSFGSVRFLKFPIHNNRRSQEIKCAKNLQSKNEVPDRRPWVSGETPGLWPPEARSTEGRELRGTNFSKGRELRGTKFTAFGSPDLWSRNGALHIRDQRPLVLNENLKTQQTKFQEKKSEFTSRGFSNGVSRHQKILKLAGKAFTQSTNLPMDLKRKSANVQRKIEGIAGQKSPVEPDFLVLHGSKFVLKAPYYSQDEAIQYQKTYSVGLFLPVSQKSARQSGPGPKTFGRGGPPSAAAFGSRPDSRRLNQSFSAGSPRGSGAGAFGQHRHPIFQRSQTLSAVESGNSLVQDQQKVWFYFGDIPLMTDRGSFIINGAPRVLVNQIIRCPSVYFKVKLDQKNRRTYIASFLSEYGSWLRLETDRLGKRIWARIDKSPRFPAELLLLGLGYTDKGSKERSGRRPPTEGCEDRRSVHSAGRAGELLERNSRPQPLVEGFPERSSPKPSTRDLLSYRPQVTSGPTDTNGAESNRHRQSIRKLKDQRKTKQASDQNSLSESAAVALQTIWKKCNPGRWTSSLGCYSFFYNKFLNPKRYSIGRVGRLRLNKRLLRNPECRIPTLTPEDILLAFNYLRQLRSSESFTIRNSGLELDDIDHLKNRRVRLPGEILQNQFRLALSRITWSALRFQNQAVTSSQLNLRSVEDRRARPLVGGAPRSSRRPEAPFGPLVEGSGPAAGPSVSRIRRGERPQASLAKGKTENYGPAIPAFQNTLRELFNTGQLSQYMDQTNPLAEITHKRRLSSLGPGGVGRDQAGFAVREIHPSHFGRICPIETPEGQNAGLVGSLASYARINGDGFLQSPCIPIETNLSTVAEAPDGCRTFDHPRPLVEERGFAHSPPKTFGPSQPRLKISLFSSELEDEIYVCTGDTLNPISRKPTEVETSIFDVELHSAQAQAAEQRSGPLWSFGGLRRTESNEGPGESFARPKATYGPEGSSLPQFPSVFPVRYKQEFFNIKKMDALNLTAAPTKLFTGVCPIQLISIATSLIPFLEHDDANRALMGSNMQRQAVPFLSTEKPFVGTGLELQAARDSSTLVLAKQSGQVIFLDSNFIDIQSQGWDPSFPQDLRSVETFGERTPFAAKDLWSFGPSQRPHVPAGGAQRGQSVTRSSQTTIHSYSLTSFLPSNQSTCLKQKPAVEIGEWVEKGSLLADGAGTKDGEVTLGKNVLLAYMPWEGYNFEDAIVISERLVFEDIYTSIHVERFDVDIKNTKILSVWPGTPLEGEQNLFPGMNASFLRIDQIGAGEYLTSDLDLFTLKVGAAAAFGSRSRPSEAQSNQSDGPDRLDASAEGPEDQRSRPDLRSVEERSSRPSVSRERTSFVPQGPPSNESFSKQGRLRPRSLQHLDKNGIVKPGTWVQEGDILVGKIQLGGPADQRSGALRSGEGIAGGRENPQYGTLTEKTPTLPSNARNLPFPEYRLLLAIFDLQNPRSGTESRVDKTLGTAEKKVLESEMLGMTKGPKVFDGEWAKPRSSTEGLEERSSRPTEGRQRSRPDLRSVEGGPGDSRATKLITTGSTIRASSVLRNPQAIQNTSAKVGIGVKGRVLDCLFDGNFVIGVNPNVLLSTQAKEDRRSRDDGRRPPKAVSPEERSQPGTPSGAGEAPAHQIEESRNDGESRFVQHGHTCSSVSVFLAHKKRIQLGDKMSGRHGNKGIVSLILPPQDMPYLQDGKPIDVVLNPLGVPSRMNVGQVLETLFGLSAFYSQKIYRILPFDERMNPRASELRGASPETSRSLVYGYLRNLRKTLQGRGDWLFDPNNPGKTHVFDGRTGESFYQPVLVGYSYMFKLIHLVDDKIHARSTGPYSLVTQQPLGGRSKKGGQRLGEMEVWALQGFGTASILQEFLTVKSDEIYSRNHFLFHLMRRNWESLERIPNLPSGGGGAPAQRSSSRLNDQRSWVEERSLLPKEVPAPFAPATQTSGLSVARLPESFRVLMNELHALCLSVYSNLPN